MRSGGHFSAACGGRKTARKKIISHSRKSVNDGKDGQTKRTEKQEIINGHKKPQKRQEAEEGNRKDKHPHKKQGGQNEPEKGQYDDFIYGA